MPQPNEMLGILPPPPGPCTVRMRNKFEDVDDGLCMPRELSVWRDAFELRRRVAGSTLDEGGVCVESCSSLLS